MKILFIVQGEGRGHMTQALALQDILRDAGHELVGVLVGHSPQRTVPRFFLDRIAAPVDYFASPNFLFDKDNRAVQITRTVVFSLLHLPRFAAGLRQIHRRVRELDPDVILSFYDVLAGLYARFFRPRARVYCLANQYMFLHPEYEFPPGLRVARWQTQAFTWLTALGARRRLAMSFTPAADVAAGFAHRRLVVVPPLIRREVLAQAPRPGEHLLVYLLNAGYAEEIVAWHRRRPEVEVHCFWDNADAEPEWRCHDRLTFHQLDADKFLALMTTCRGVVSNSGFQLINEAMYLGKPIFMVPVGGHFEQMCNARNASRDGAGLWDERFDLDRFLDYLPEHRFDATAYRRWVAEAGERMLAAMELPRLPS